MSIHPLVGHEPECEMARRAAAAGWLPQVLLLTGPKGVGKQRFGLWLSQMLLCEGEGTRPCGSCQSCRLASNLAHPDLHWVIPTIRPKASDPEKQVEEVADAIGAVVEERRARPLYQPTDGMAGHFLATVRLLQRRAALTPALGRKKVFLVAEADRLVSQEASKEAANALLKLLEEPPADCQFILTVVNPNRLLPTMRSRAVPMRLGRLSDGEVESFLAAHLELEDSALRQRVAEAQGAIGQAVALGEESAKAYRAAEELLRAVGAGAAARSERAMKQGPWQARGDFTGMLDALSMLIADAGRVATGLEPRRPLPEILTRPSTLQALVAAQGHVTATREAAQGNVNPQLLLAALADELAEAL